MPMTEADDVPEVSAEWFKTAKLKEPIPQAAIDAALDVFGELNVSRDEVIEALQAAAPFMQEQNAKETLDALHDAIMRGKADGIEAAAQRVAVYPNGEAIAAAIRELKPVYALLSNIAPETKP